jgi:5'-3' exonuclease
MSEKMVLIDFSSVARPIFESAGDPSQCHVAMIEKIRALSSGQPHVAICCDSGKSFRHDISADYKANRAATPAVYLHQCEMALDVLRRDGFPVWSAKGYEADDVIGSAVRWGTISAHPEKPSDNMLIISADKDLLQLVSERVEQFSPASGKTRDDAAVVFEFGVQPNQIVDYLALVGDASDNIKGAAGIGPKKAADLLATFGNLDDLYRAAEAGGASITPAVFMSLMNFKPRLAEVRELLTLRTDVPLPFEEILKERVPQDVAVFGDDEEMMADINEAMPTLPDAKVFGVVPQSPAVTVLPPPPTDAVHTRVVPNGGDSGRSQPSTALVAAPPEWERGLEPRSLSEAKSLSDSLMASRLFGAYGHPAGILATILAGRELGIPPMASLRAFHIIDSKPVASAGLIQARIMQSPKCEYFRCIERTAEAATFATKRKGDPEVQLRYTIEEARQAWTKPIEKFAQSGYGKNPADMLVARATSKLARLVYPDVVMGLYGKEEFDEQ